MATALCNEQKQPILHLTFSNGWTASLMVRGNNLTSLAAGIETTAGFIVEDLGEQEASDDEVAFFVSEVAHRPPRSPASASIGHIKDMLRRPSQRRQT